MTIPCFHQLQQALDGCRQEFENLQWAVVQAQPEGGHALADQFEATVADLLSYMQDSTQAAQRLAGVQTPWKGRHLLARCQRPFTASVRQCEMELFGFEQLEALLTLAGSEGMAWASWAYGVRDGLQRTRLYVLVANEAFFECWQRIGADSHEQPGAVNQVINLGPGVVGQAVYGQQPNAQSTASVSGGET